MSKTQQTAGEKPRIGEQEVRRAADEYISQGVSMGEGWLIPAEMAMLAKSGTKNIICAQPFGCLPNHIVGKGMIRKIKAKNPIANIVPIDYDPGASEVNQLNRIKLMLSVAREQLEQSIQSDTDTSNNVPPTPPVEHSP